MSRRRSWPCFPLQNTRIQLLPTTAHVTVPPSSRATLHRHHPITFDHPSAPYGTQPISPHTSPHFHRPDHPSAPLINPCPQLKRIVPPAVERAILEILSPVVERSVTIACYTTVELLVKDFATDPDETRMRKVRERRGGGAAAWSKARESGWTSCMEGPSLRLSCEENDTLGVPPWISVSHMMPLPALLPPKPPS